MTLQQLQYFRVMSKILHYTKAAEVLYTSQPNLSHSLSQLETELGVPLFFKVGKKIFLTEAGRVFKLTVDEIMKKIEDGIAEVKSFNDLKVTNIRLGYIQSLSSTLIPDIIEGYYKYKGNNAVEFTFTPNHETNLFKSLENNDLDIIFDGKYHEKYNSKPISKQELVLVVPKHHRFVKSGIVNFNELSEENIIMLREGTGLYMTVKQFFVEKNTKLNVCLIACDYNAALNYVSIGKGISFLPSDISIGKQNINIIKIRDINCIRPIYMTWITDRCLNDSASDFIDFVQNHFNEDV